MSGRQARATREIAETRVKVSLRGSARRGREIGEIRSALECAGGAGPPSCSMLTLRESPFPSLF